jgi:hypothetical protein
MAIGRSGRQPPNPEHTSSRAFNLAGQPEERLKKGDKLTHKVLREGLESSRYSLKTLHFNETSLEALPYAQPGPNSKH